MCTLCIQQKFYVASTDGSYNLYIYIYFFKNWNGRRIVLPDVKVYYLHIKAKGNIEITRSNASSYLTK